jgi:hypothetical protein
MTSKRPDAPYIDEMEYLPGKNRTQIDTPDNRQVRIGRM